MQSSRHYIPSRPSVQRVVVFIPMQSFTRTIYPPPPHLFPSVYSALTASWIAAKSALGFAPTISWTFSSVLKIRKVGMAWIPSSCATSGTSSTSSLTKYAPVNSSENLHFSSVRASEEGREGDELDDLRSDDFAGSAPGCESVDDYDLVLLESGIEFSLAVTQTR
jgi:hypothetical protein